jgi:ADP-heptose:LPS heptosyltransferase
MLARLLGPTQRITAAEAGARLRQAKTILLIKPHQQIGRLLMATPIIRNLRLALPDARLIFVAGQYNAPAVLDHPDLDEVIVACLRGPLAPFRALGLLYRLRRVRADAALVLSTISHSTSAVLLARWSKPGFVVGMDGSPYGSNLAQLGYDCILEQPEDIGQVHMVDCRLTLLEQLGIPISDRRHVLGVTEEQADRGRALLAGAGIDPDRPILGAQVGGTPHRPERQWPPVDYAGVLQRASLEMGYQPLLLGRGRDRPSMEQVQALGKSHIPSLLDLPFPEYKGVLSQLTFFVTHDGGPVHVAAGVGVPSYFIFFSTPPWEWAPYGNHISVWEDYGRVPNSAEVWERMRPLLARAAVEGPPPAEGPPPE